VLNTSCVSCGRDSSGSCKSPIRVNNHASAAFPCCSCSRPLHECNSSDLKSQDPSMQARPAQQRPRKYGNNSRGNMALLPFLRCWSPRGEKISWRRTVNSLLSSSHVTLIDKGRHQHSRHQPTVGSWRHRAQWAARAPVPQVSTALQASGVQAISPQASTVLALPYPPPLHPSRCLNALRRLSCSRGAGREGPVVPQSTH
jgi:hypothetical protein